MTLKMDDEQRDKAMSELIERITGKPWPRRDPNAQPVYLNDFHREYMEASKKQIAEWAKNPSTIEEVRAQQAMLDRQRAEREAKKNK